LKDSNVSEQSERRSNYRTSLVEAGWKAGAKEGDSPVNENGFMLLVITLKYGEAKTTLSEAGRTRLPKLNTQHHR